MEAGAAGLTVAKVGEAEQMARVADDLLLAYPAVDPLRCERLARLAREAKLRVAIDSTQAADSLSRAAAAAGSVLGILVDIDVGMHRTGVQTAKDALKLAQYVDAQPRLRVDGIMFYPGHLADPATAETGLRDIDRMLAETIDGWTRAGLAVEVVSGGSTPTAYLSHHMNTLTEIRPGTYVYHDMNGVRGGYATLDDCAARIVCTIVSDAVPGQVVIDAGTKTLTSDRCGPAPESGFGYVVEYPEAIIIRLTEEHGQVDVSPCDTAPAVGDQLTVIPNHVCPCVNLQDIVWLRENGAEHPLPVDARGQVI
jgi:D-serine deaminase-like pyridoxal phosphate-dependent protein